MAWTASTHVITLCAVLSVITAWGPSWGEGFSSEQLADNTCTMMRDPAVPQLIKTKTKQNVDQLLTKQTNRTDYKQIQRGYQLARAKCCI